MMMPNVLMAVERKRILEEINGSENQRRKNESLKRFDIYSKRQATYVKEKLVSEYSVNTVNDMRVISSINLGRRIIDKSASLYKSKPSRTFERPNKTPLSENETKQLEAIYESSGLDMHLKKSNKYYKLEQQGCVQIIPRDGVLQPRVLLPHHYDVIPMDGDPEKAYGYIISVYDRSLLYHQQADAQTTASPYLPQNVSDGINTVIADSDDFKALEGQKYIWWTPEWNFVTDSRGNIIDQYGQQVMIRTEADLALIANPIQRLPFVDIACEKEFEFWVRQGNDIIDFALDFSVLLSDTAEVNKRQGYSQAIVYSEEPPKDVSVGPNRILHIKLDSDKEQQARFEWANPSPDLEAALSLLETYLSLFLTSQGIDPKTVTGKGEGQRYASGFERLLAMIEQFEASQDDMELYRVKEQEILDLFVAWSNLLQGATIQAGIEPLKPDLNQAVIPSDVKVEACFARPQATQSKSEVEDSEIKKLENGLTTRKRAIMAIEGINDDAAEKLLLEIDQENSPTPTMDSGDVDGADTAGQIQN